MSTHLRRTALLLVALTLACACAGPALAQTNAPRIGAQFRFWDFDGPNDLRDYVIYVVPGHWHAAAEVWDSRFGSDQLRPELGGYLVDRRGSTYSGLVRMEGGLRMNFETETGQVLGGGLVARALVRTIVGFDEPTRVLWGGGVDRYYGDYSFASASAYRDPRFGGRWTYTLLNRVATEHGYLQAGFTPAEARPAGWFVTAKVHWLVAGFERNSRYDFSNRDNRIWTLGLEFPLPAPRR